MIPTRIEGDYGYDGSPDPAPVEQKRNTTTYQGRQIAAVIPGEQGRSDAVIYDIPPEQRITGQGPVNTISVPDPYGNVDGSGRVVSGPLKVPVPDEQTRGDIIRENPLPANIDPYKISANYNVASDVYVDASGHVYGWNKRASDYNRPLDADPYTVSRVKNQYGSASLFNYTRQMYGSPSDPLGWNTFAAQMNQQYGAGTYGYLRYGVVKPYEHDQMFGTHQTINGHTPSVSVLDQARSQNIPGGSEWYAAGNKPPVSVKVNFETDSVIVQNAGYNGPWSQGRQIPAPGNPTFAPYSDPNVQAAQAGGSSNLAMLSVLNPAMFKPLTDIAGGAVNLYMGYIQGVARQRDENWSNMVNQSLWDTARNKSLTRDERYAAFEKIAGATSGEALANMPLDSVGGMGPGIVYGNIIRKAPVVGPVYKSAAGVVYKTSNAIGGTVQGTIDQIGARSVVNTAYTMSTESVGKQILDYAPYQYSTFGQIKNAASIPGRYFSPSAKASAADEFIATEWAEYNTIKAAQEKIATEELFTGNPNLGYGGNAAAIENKPYTFGYALEVETPPAAQVGIGTFGPRSPFDAPGITAMPGERSLMWVPEKAMPGYIAPENPTIVRSYFPISYEDYTRIGYPNKMPVATEYVPVYGASSSKASINPVQNYQTRVNTRLNEMFPNAGTYNKNSFRTSIKNSISDFMMNERAEISVGGSSSYYRSVPTETEQVVLRYRTEVPNSKMFSSSSEIEDFTRTMFKTGGETKAIASEGVNMLRTGLYSGIASISINSLVGLSKAKPTGFNPAISIPSPIDNTDTPIPVPRPVSPVISIPVPVPQPEATTIVTPIPDTAPVIDTPAPFVPVPNLFKPYSGPSWQPPRARPGPIGPFILPSFDFGGSRSTGGAGKFGKGYVRDVKNPFLSVTFGAKKKRSKSKHGGKKR